MIQIVRNLKQVGVKDFVCDKKDELSKINLRTTLMGSSCYVIEEDVTYILNGSGEWVKASSYKGGGGGSSSGGGSSAGGDSEHPSDTIPPDTPIDESNTYIWDGGEVI